MENIIKFEGSKSIIQRVLIISSFLKSPLKIINSSRCEDVQTLIFNLKKLGFNFEDNNNYLVIFSPKEIRNFQELFIQNSGTALRLLLSRLAMMKGIETSVDCSIQLKKRPIKPLLEILQKFGSVKGECCAGLHEISSGYRNGVAYCTSEVCGNGECKALENKWNCPKDCETIEPELEPELEPEPTVNIQPIINMIKQAIEKLNSAIRLLGNLTR